MRIELKKYSVFILFILISLTFLLFNIDQQKIPSKRSDRIRPTSSPKTGIEMKNGRAEFFNRILRDPATGKIPVGIRQKELAFAKQLQEKANSLNKPLEVMDLGWKEAGPADVGGRTRALAVDIKNPNTILAGGITGGIWKSTDRGKTWQMKSTTNQMLSVTTLAQDPRDGHTNNWYYGTGEFFWGNSAQDRGQTAMYSGDGIYKSTDNGETWNILPVTSGTNPTQWNKSFDFVLKIAINPKTGTVFVATFGDGIFRSTDGGNSFQLVLGGNYNHFFSDIDIASNGTMVSVVSSTWNDVTPENQPGVYKSTNDGESWQNITPQNFPEQHMRTIVEIAPSNPNTAYILSFTGGYIDEKYDDIRFFKLNLGNGAAEDRSANMPVFSFGDDEAYFDTQYNYNMTMAVKPDNENFIVIGATSLFRTVDGFATKPSNSKTNWIGGYHPEEFFYPNLHPDVHSYAFDPTNPNTMWWGHDGGLSYTSDITNTNYTRLFPWENMNNGYNVTQFYNIAIPNEAGDNRIMGGTQDNGTPAFKFDGTNISQSNDVSSGDGSYCYYGDDYPYVSTQNGTLIRGTYDQSGNPVREYPNYCIFTPEGAKNMLFINPYAINPNNEDIMIYSAGNSLWRNNQLSSLPNNPNFSSKTSQGWTQLTGLDAPSGFVFSSLAFSQNSPSNRLYFGASDWNENPGAPKIYRLDNANTSSSGAVALTLPGATAGSYVHNIAANPDNGDEVIVILSNYNVPGIYYSSNGGQSFTTVEGNLEGNDSNPGPSIRAATIVPIDGGTLYLVATSIGVYSTTSLNGDQTAWTHEGSNVLGNVIVEHITSRKSDGKIVAGTHGRGAFAAQAASTGTPIPVTSVQTLTLQSNPGSTGSTSFDLKNEGDGNLNFNITVEGNFNGDSPVTERYVMFRNKNTESSSRFRDRILNETTNEGKFEENLHKSNSKKLSKTLGEDVLFLDDGDDSADDVFGWGYGAGVIYWYNEFNLSGFDFDLEAFAFFMRTNNSSYNDIYAALYDQNGSVLSDATFSMPLSTNGDWYFITFDSPISFSSGETFYLEIGSLSFIDKPIGVDIDAQIPNKSYYGDGFSYYNLNTVSGGENGAFLIRAIGTIGGGGSENQNPVAVAQISNPQPQPGESVTFDAGQSYDNDGQITSYSWNFGDGSSGSQKVVTHSYSQEGSYTYSLTVTDDKGATGQTSGQINVTDPSNQLVTVDPASGTVAPGGTQKITLTLNASELSEGSYVGQVKISTNGGNINIPIDYLVNVEQISEIPQEYSLSQNYPNPFNPSTTIEFSLPKRMDVSLKIFDLLGREVITLLNEEKNSGIYKVQFTPSNLSSGVYVYRLETTEFTDSKKLILLK